MATPTSNIPSQTVVTSQPNPWAEYFGPPAYEYRIDVNQRASVDRSALPKAYIGQNLFVAEVIEGFIVSQTDADWTQVILPIVRTDDLNIAYNTWKFDATLAGRVPHEGTSRLVRSSKSSHSDKMVRYGLGMILEHGFMNTEEGRKTYALNIQQIVQATQLTMSYDALVAILTAKRFDIQWLMERGFFNQDLPEVMKEEVAMFGILQKDVNGFDIAIEQHKKRMSRYSTVPDALILPSKACIYIPMVPEAKHLYSNRGDLGVQQFENGSLTTFRGIRVFEAHTYDIYENEMPVNLCSSVEQIGQFNVMPFDQYANPKEYKSHHRDILIYDADTDNFERISFCDGLKHSMRFDNGSYEDGETWASTHKDHATQDAFVNKSGKYAKYFGQLDLEKYTTDGFLFCVKTMLNHVDDAVLDKLKAGGELIARLQASTGPAPADPERYEEGASGFGYTWNSLKVVAKSTGESGKIAKEFITAFETFVAIMEKIVPESEGGSQTNIVFDALNSDQEMAFVEYLTDDSDVGVSSQIEQPIQSKHEFNEAALVGVEPEHAKAYMAAVGKYAPESAMYKRIVHDTSRLVKKHMDDLNSPEISAKIKLMHKISGNVSSDEKILSRMMPAPTAEELAAASPKKWKMSHIAWTEGCEGKPNMRKYEAPKKDKQKKKSAGFSRRTVDNDDDQEIGAEGDLDEFQDALSESSKAVYWANSLSHFAERLAAKMLMYLPLTMSAIEKLCMHHVAVPFDIVLVRPFISFEMLHGVLMKAGSATGNTFVGHADFQLGDDVRSKLHIGNFTFYSKAIVTNPKNIQLLKNIYINEYRGGMNSRFIGKHLRGQDLREPEFQEPGRDSIFSMVVAPGSTKYMKNPLDLRKAFPYYSSKYALETLNDTTVADQYFEPGEKNSANPICYRGMSYSYEKDTGKFSKITLGTGHLGSDIYVGVVNCWNGAAKYVEKQHYNQSY